MDYSPWCCKESDTTEWLNHHHQPLWASLVAQIVKNLPAVRAKKWFSRHLLKTIRQILFSRGERQSSTPVSTGHREGRRGKGRRREENCKKKKKKTTGRELVCVLKPPLVGSPVLIKVRLLLAHFDMITFQWMAPKSLRNTFLGSRRYIPKNQRNNLQLQVF